MLFVFTYPVLNAYELCVQKVSLQCSLSKAAYSFLHHAGLPTAAGLGWTSGNT